MTRRAISPRLAMRTFLNMRGSRAGRSRRSTASITAPAEGSADTGHLLGHLGGQIQGLRLRLCRVAGDLREFPIRGRVHAGYPERELVRIGGIEHCALVGDQPVLV